MFSEGQMTTCAGLLQNSSGFRYAQRLVERTVATSIVAIRGVNPNCLSNSGNIVSLNPSRPPTSSAIKQDASSCPSLNVADVRRSRPSSVITQSGRTARINVTLLGIVASSCCGMVALDLWWRDEPFQDTFKAISVRIDRRICLQRIDSDLTIGECCHFNCTGSTRPSQRKAVT